MDNISNSIDGHDVIFCNAFLCCHTALWTKVDYWECCECRTRCCMLLEMETCCHYSQILQPFLSGESRDGGHQYGYKCCACTLLDANNSRINSHCCGSNIQCCCLLQYCHFPCNPQSSINPCLCSCCFLTLYPKVKPFMTQTFKQTGYFEKI
jgi:hypothetical protein